MNAEKIRLIENCLLYLGYKKELLLIYAKEKPASIIEILPPWIEKQSIGKEMALRE